MSTLTIVLPDRKHERLKVLAEQRHISINELMEKISTIVLAEFDAEMRFRARAAKGLRNGLGIVAEILGISRTSVYNALKSFHPILR